jgi:hypothetical protein
MTDLPPSDPNEDVDAAAGMPRWVKVFGIVGLVALLFVLITLLLGVNHGPGMHSLGNGTQTVGSTATESLH